MGRLVLVSNRVVVPDRLSMRHEGGLTVALRAALEESGGLWFGWSGKIVDGRSREAQVLKRGKVTYAVMDLSTRDYDEYYGGFANRTLWPLFHSRTDLTEIQHSEMSGYLRVNAQFARHLGPLLRPTDLIWIHDYHLMHLARYLRGVGCRQRMGFFLHIPWPPRGLFSVLPNHRELARSLCSHDVVGFQTTDDLRAFVEYVTVDAGGRQIDERTIRAFDREVRVGVFPVSIDVKEFAALAKQSAGSRLTKRLLDSLNGRRLIIGVDRLDYSKGLIKRLRAFDYLLGTYPEKRGHVTMLQITPRSRSDVPEYQDIRRKIESWAGRINGSYGEFDWVPVRYMNRGFSRRTLAGFLRVARIGLVTPLRDGMNLVAKEYVAAQDPEDPGVLVLSRFAGAARELDAALLVNPYDIEAVGEALHKADDMPLDERRDRWSAMYQILRQRDVKSWRESFVKVLSKASVPV